MVPTATPIIEILEITVIKFSNNVSVNFENDRLIILLLIVNNESKKIMNLKKGDFCDEAFRLSKLDLIFFWLEKVIKLIAKRRILIISQVSLLELKYLRAIKIDKFIPRAQVVSPESQLGFRSGWRLLLQYL